MAPSGDPYSSSTWKLSDGTIIWKDMKKSMRSDEQSEIWKFNKGQVWYFLEFNTDKLLKSVKLASLDLDTVS